MTAEVNPAAEETESGEKVGKAAALISGLTLLSRIAGFGRILVLTWAVGFGTLNDVYNTASRVPNIIYEIVAGGALASLVIPLLAAPLARKEPGVVNRTASGLMTWTLAILVPLAIAVALFAEPIMQLLAGPKEPAFIDMGARMIRVFAPQLPLYGVGIILTGILQAHRRFAWPALAPLLSSLTVSAAYLLFAMRSQADLQVEQVPLTDELILSVGTTMATVVMTFCLLIPMRKLGLKLRPTFRFGGGRAGREVRTMAFAGVITTGAWQLSLLLVLNLTNDGPKGTVGLFTLALTLYMLPWGVLAVPLATSAYPALSEAHGVGDQQTYASTLARTTRMLFILVFLGVAALAGLAVPLARVFGAIGNDGNADPVYIVAGLTESIAALAPGLVGFALFALLTRALYARGAPMAAAAATLVGWVVVYGSAIALSQILPVENRALAVALGNSIGMTVLGIALLLTVVRYAGRQALAGTWRAGSVALVAAVLAAAAGWAVARLWGADATVGESIVAAIAGGVTILVVYLLVVVVTDSRDMRPMAVSMWSRLRGKRKDLEKVAKQ